MQNEQELVLTADKNGKISLMACACMLVESIQGQATAHVFQVLFDTGGTGSMLNEKSLSPGVTVAPVTLVAQQRVNTLVGHMTTIEARSMSKE